MANRYQNGAGMTPGTGFAGAGVVPNRASSGLTSVPYPFVPQSFPFPGQPSSHMPLDISSQLQGVYQQGGAGLAPAGVARQMFVPGAMTTPYPSPHIPNQQRGSTMTAAGQRAWQDEQQRAKERQQKERDYIQQQQRLRQFGSGGGERLNSAQFMANMFGTNHSNDLQQQQQQPTTASSQRSGRRKVDPGQQPPRASAPTSSAPRPQHQAAPLSTLSVSGLVATPFQASQKARDWSNLEDLHNVFSPPTASSGLPPWCQPGAALPPLYTQIEQYATRQGVIDTSLLYPVLVSSGLSRETLGHIWTLANRSTPGLLTRPELYAVLALIALAQNACQITSLDILHTLHAPPIPLFNQISSPPSTTPTGGGIQPATLGAAPTSLPHPAPPSTLAAVPSADGATLAALASDDFDDFQTASSLVAPAPAVPSATFVGPILSPGGVGSRLANHNLAQYQPTHKTTGQLSVSELSFNGALDTASSTTPAAAAAAVSAPEQQSYDEFSDFQCAQRSLAIQPLCDASEPVVTVTTTRPSADPARIQHLPTSSDHRRTCSDGGSSSSGGFRPISLDKLVPGLLTVSPTVQHFPPVPSSDPVPVDQTVDRYSVFRTLEQSLPDNDNDCAEDDFGDFLGGGSLATLPAAATSTSFPVGPAPLPVAAAAAASSTQSGIPLPALYDPHPVSSGGYDFFDPLGSLDDEPLPPPPGHSGTSGDTSVGQLHSVAGFGGHLFPPPPPPSSSTGSRPHVVTTPADNSADMMYGVSSSPATLPAVSGNSKLMSRHMSQMHGIHLTENDDADDDDFGDFMAPTQTDSDSGGGGGSALGVVSGYLSTDGQSVSSLDLASGATDTVGAVLGRHGSVPSLDLKVFGSWDQEEDEEDAGEDGDEHRAGVASGSDELEQGGLASSTIAIGAAVPRPPVTGAGTQPPQSRPALTVLPVAALVSSQPLVDRYSLIRGEVAAEGGSGWTARRQGDVHEYEWRRCLDNCYQLIKNALNIFNGVSSSAVSNEVTNSEEGHNYIKNIVQVYRLACRIAQSTKNSNANHKLDQLLKDIESEWNKLLSFILGSPNFPREDYFNFESDVLPATADNLSRACGVCLLDVDSAHGRNHQQQLSLSTTTSGCSTSGVGADEVKLSYGGRHYHHTCANFWVNCVDSLLPALPPIVGVVAAKPQHQPPQQLHRIQHHHQPLRPQQRQRTT